MRDAQSCTTSKSPKEIHFTDPELERRDVLNIFLYLLVFPTRTFQIDHDLDLCLSLIGFLQKYDCPQVIEIFRLSLTRILVEEEWNAVEIFALGAALDDSILCSTAVFYEERSRYDHPGAKHFSVSDIPVAALEHIPQEYLRGLADAVPPCEGKPCDCPHDQDSSRAANFEANVGDLKHEMKIAREKRRHPDNESGSQLRRKKKKGV